MKNQDSEVYNDFMANNSGVGNLKIRATSASESLPISDLKIVVSTVINDYKVIFYDGMTDSSGMIKNLSLPVPKINSDNLIIPETITYEIEANYLFDNNTKVYDINMYDGICVVQNIYFVPDSKGNGVYGS